MRIFISYRRSETEAYAGRLYDSLMRLLPGVQIFMDVDSLRPGEDFVERLETALSSAQVGIVMIGREWLTVQDESGRARLSNERDFVRQEVEKAMIYCLAVIPVLVQGASLPTEDQLPGTLKSLARRQPIELHHQTWAADASLLVDRIEEIVGKKPRWSSISSFPGMSSRLPSGNLLLCALLICFLILGGLAIYQIVNYMAAAPRREIDALADQVSSEYPAENVRAALNSLRAAVVKKNKPELTDIAVARLKEVVLADSGYEGNNTPNTRLVRTLALQTIRDLRSNDLRADFPGHGFKDADIDGVDLSRTNLQGVSLENASVERANFSGSNLTSSDLSGAFVLGAVFTGANLSGADLYEVDWFNAVGFTLPMLRGGRTEAMACPKEKDKGLHNQPAFEAELRSEYDTTLGRLGAEGASLKQLWDDYRKPGGICEQVDKLKRAE